MLVTRSAVCPQRAVKTRGGVLRLHVDEGVTPSPFIGVVMQRYRWIIAGLSPRNGMGLSAVARIVDISGAGQYTSIQTAVSASSLGDTGWGAIPGCGMVNPRVFEYAKYDT